MCIDHLLNRYYNEQKGVMGQLTRSFDPIMNPLNQPTFSPLITQDLIPECIKMYSLILQVTKTQAVNFQLNIVLMGSTYFVLVKIHKYTFGSMKNQKIVVVLSQNM